MVFDVSQIYGEDQNLTEEEKQNRFEKFETEFEKLFPPKLTTLDLVCVQRIPGNSLTKLGSKLSRLSLSLSSVDPSDWASFHLSSLENLTALEVLNSSTVEFLEKVRLSPHLRLIQVRSNLNQSNLSESNQINSRHVTPEDSH